MASNAKALAELQELLLSSTTETELRRLFRQCYDYKVLAELPGERTPHAEFVHQACLLLDRRGLLDDALFAALVELTPRRSAEIAAVAQRLREEGRPQADPAADRLVERGLDLLQLRATRYRRVVIAAEVLAACVLGLAAAMMWTAHFDADIALHRSMGGIDDLKQFDARLRVIEHEYRDALELREEVEHLTVHGASGVIGATVPLADTPEGEVKVLVVERP